MIVNKKYLIVRAAILTTFAAVSMALTSPVYAAEVESKMEAFGPEKITSCRTIDKPGSYLVTKNLTAQEGHNCIVIAASNITLDLGGFVLSGKDSADTQGITDSDIASRRVVVRNGKIRRFDTGIDLLSTTSVVVEGVDVDRIKSEGIGVGRFSHVSKNSISTRSVVDGFAIKAGPGSAVRDNIVEGGGTNDDGIIVSVDSIVSGNIVNVVEGIGIKVGDGSLVSDNVASFSGSIGIQVEKGSTVTGNTVRSFGDPEEVEFSAMGIEVVCPSTVIGNTAINSDLNLTLIDSGCIDVNNLAP